MNYFSSKQRNYEETYESGGRTCLTWEHLLHSIHDAWWARRQISNEAKEKYQAFAEQKIVGQWVGFALVAYQHARCSRKDPSRASSSYHLEHGFQQGAMYKAEISVLCLGCFCCMRLAPLCEIVNLFLMVSLPPRWFQHPSLLASLKAPVFISIHPPLCNSKCL